ncbi:MAG: hypothetical protein KBC81_02845 [Candidatus Pacebacteria bacterium]|nr:hypothetical protein [Candidatus Paceibacterota bacterium]
MSDFEDLTIRQAIDLGNKIGGQAGAKRIMSGELVLVERDRKVSASGLANGGVTYATGIDTKAFLADWRKHFREVYGLIVDLSGIQLPPQRQGFGWGVVRVPELSAQKMFDTFTTKFKTCKWCDNIDKVLDIGKEARTTANGPYVVWLRDRVEADEELKNLSANYLAERNINCITEPERIALEGWFHWKTGGHLDIKNVTLSAGSRWSDGSVPGARWYDGVELYVSRYLADDRDGIIRAREVVSLS